jgi:hypothetical protein
MAAPNLQAPTTVTGKTTYLSLSATTETTLLSNAAASNKALRIANLTVANKSTTTSASIAAKIYTAASAGTGYSLAATVTVPVGAVVILIGKENPVWLEEDKRITVTAGTANILDVVCSYEEVA